MMELSKGIERAAGAGFFTRPPVERYPDASARAKASHEVAADAETVGKPVKAAAEVPSKRRDNLRDTVNA